MADNLSKRIFHGARAKFYMGGKQVGHGTGVGATRSFELMKHNECGSDITQAIVLMGQSVTMDASFVRIFDEDMVQLALMPGGEEGALLAWDEMTAVIYDRVSGKAMYEIRGLMPSREDFRYDARSLCANGASWEGRIFLHTSELA